MKCNRLILAPLILLLFGHPLHAADFHLDSPRNKDLFRFEIDNDAVWHTDSQFSNGWSLQYHTAAAGSWKETSAPALIKWVGNNFPTLSDESSIVRYGHGIGQNMITPEDIELEIPQEGDIPYAGTLTYSLNWQRFNRQSASNFQISAGILGEEAFAEQFQKFIHNDLGLGKDPQGWDTQRESEAIVNLGYQYLWRLAHLGTYDNGWAAQLSLVPSGHVGNLFTAAEIGIGLRFGWNIHEGFHTYPSPPGRGFFQAYDIPKPASVSAHGFEVVVGGRATGLLYSVLYDGSLITDDDREVEREDFVFAGAVSFNYHYYDFLTIRLSFLQTTDVIVEESLPEPIHEGEQTETDNSYGTLVIDLRF